MWSITSHGVLLIAAVTVLGTHAMHAHLPSSHSVGLTAPPASTAVAHHTRASDDLAVVKQAILSELVSKSPNGPVDTEVTAIAASLTPEGTWTDVDYKDDSRSWWAAADHLRRTLLMATAVNSPLSTHYNSAEIREVAERALSWWCKNDPQNQWWWMQIGVPRAVAKCLLLLNNASLVTAAQPLLSRTPLDDSWTGCNRVWGASFHILHAALTSNTTEMGLAYAMAHSTLAISPQSGDGIQSDGSFHQHGPQLYSGWGYGTIYTTNVLVLESYAKGTQWAMSNDLWQVFSHLVLDGQGPSTRGANYDFLACGRLFTYFRVNDTFGVNQGHYHYFAAFSPFELAFPTFEPPFTTPIGVFFAPLLGAASGRARADEFASLSDRFYGKAPDVASHKHFYDSDYTVYHRESMATFVHMLSSRTLATECVNDENKRGRMMADGTTTIYADQDQYIGSFPLFNWTTLPGTTEVQSAAQDAETPEHACGAIRSGDIRRDFVGGLSEGDVGVSAMDFARGTFESVNKYTEDVQVELLVDDRAAMMGALPPTCANATSPQVGVHCDIANSTPLSNSVTNTSDACAALCCANTKCSCWTWTSYEQHGSDICPFGKPCCWLKQSDSPLLPAPNCTAGQIKARPVPPPPPGPGPPPPSGPACIAAGKAWFFTNDTVLAMGANITRGDTCGALPVTTALQQSNLLGSQVVVGGKQGSTMQLSDNSTYTCTVGNDAQECLWVWHAGLVYTVLPSAASQTLIVSNAIRQGTEYAITQGDNTTLTAPIFSVVLSHGAAVGDIFSYMYAVLPCASPTNAHQAVAGLKTVPIVNAKSVQAVCVPGGLLQAVLWPAAQTSTNATVAGAVAGCWDVSIGNGAALAMGMVVQVRTDPINKSVVFSVAAPSAMNVAATTKTMPNISLVISGLEAHGASCTNVGTGATGVTLSLDPTGATTSVSCAV
eukprot:m.186579 g.186579  ORF g.186579 m.186579 type:complete len:944 (-) comp16811_c0_seq1:97-2928(-)